MLKFGMVKCEHLEPGMVILFSENVCMFTYIISVTHELVEGTWDCLRVIYMDIVIDNNLDEKYFFENRVVDSDSTFAVGKHAILTL